MPTSTSIHAETQFELKPVVAKLIFLDGPKAGEELPIQANEVVLGRSRRTDVCVNDPKVSRVHLKITRLGKGYRLIDQESRHGTFVNGVRVLEHPLCSFDIIELGHCKLRFMILDIAESAVAKSETTSNNRSERTLATKSMVTLSPVRMLRSLRWWGENWKRRAIAVALVGVIGVWFSMGKSPVPRKLMANEAKKESKPQLSMALPRNWQPTPLATVKPANKEEELSKLDNTMEEERRRLVSELLKSASVAFIDKRYQEAIETADKVRKIELSGDTKYLNEAKQIIDRSRILQKEEFEPFMNEVKQRLAKGEYNSSRDLLEEMLRRDPAFEDAKELLAVVRDRLQQLARDAYGRGSAFESIHQFEDARRFYQKALDYSRPGDEYYNRLRKKLRANR